MYVSFQLLDITKSECNTLDQTIITQSRLDVVYARGLQKLEVIWVEMTFQNCQKDQQGGQIKLSFTCKLDSAAWSAGTESIHLERARGVVYVRRRAKMELIVVENDLCTEVPVRLGHGKETLLKFQSS